MFYKDIRTPTICLTALEKANKKLSKIGLELESRNNSLSRNNEILDLAHIIGMQLNPFMDKQDIFDKTADLFISFDPVEVGLLYSVNPDSREFDQPRMLFPGGTRQDIGRPPA